MKSVSANVAGNNILHNSFLVLNMSISSIIAVVAVVSRINQEMFYGTKCLSYHLLPHYLVII